MQEPKPTLKSRHTIEEENSSFCALQYPPIARDIYGTKIEPWN
jgi:hypothetical protein